MRPLAVLSIVAFALNARAFQNFSFNQLFNSGCVGKPHCTIEQTLQSGQSLDFNTSFSVGIFSIASSDLLFQYHHSAPSLVNSTTGVTAVDADTIYRIGSVSKLLTVFTYLIELGDASWSDPVTKYIPELQTASGSDPVSSAAWADITVGALAAQLSGIGRDNGLGDLYSPLTAPSAYTSLGLPILNASDASLCNLTSAETCTRADFFKGLFERHAVLASFTTAIYSNVAYQLFGYVLESITGKPFASSIESSLFTPLNMSSSSFTVPNDTSRGVIPVSPDASLWNLDLGDGTPYGGMFSTLSDIAKLGRAILNSTLLSPAQTRRWLKPHSHTASLTYSVGAPWEIQRLILPLENRVVDVYTKNGDLGSYFAFFALIPEYGVGFAALGASADGGAPLDVTVVSSLIGDNFVPVLEDAARAEAEARFAGTFAAAGLNSSITLNTEAGRPGLGVSRWISNGTDMLVTLETSPFTVRLYPTTLFSDSRYAFRAVYEETFDNTGPAPAFQDRCVTWGGVDTPTYGTVAFDDFVFELGEDGVAVSVEPRFLRVGLQRTVDGTA
ncbi:putative beta-lactamase, partial [Mycena leptocephala]